MNFNFFDWLRNGVKESVILGVNDAVTCLGTPQEKDNVQQRLMGFLREDPGTTPARLGSSGSRPKKLGRSLKQIQADAKAS
ncbi:MAG: hypothetical protein GXX96_38900 [Planctomycetaceae bacterium]|nr:hypothetical protein [Planctomycetaceae bacterium]